MAPPAVLLGMSESVESNYRTAGQTTATVVASSTESYYAYFGSTTKFATNDSHSLDQLRNIPRVLVST
jgi:hypothetical protein